MAAGRPIVYSNLEIIGEVLKGRADAFVPGDASSLAEVIASVRQSGGQAELRAAQNPVDVQAYTWGARAKNILTFIQ